jgi:hypothetical protein
MMASTFFIPGSLAHVLFRGCFERGKKVNAGRWRPVVQIRRAGMPLP